MPIGRSQVSKEVLQSALMHSCSSSTITIEMGCFRVPTFVEVVSFVDAREATNSKTTVVYNTAVAKEIDIWRCPASVVTAS